MKRRSPPPQVQVVAVPHPDAEEAWRSLIDQLGESLADCALGQAPSTDAPLLHPAPPPARRRP